MTLTLEILYLPFLLISTPSSVLHKAMKNYVVNKYGLEFKFCVKRVYFDSTEKSRVAPWIKELTTGGKSLRKLCYGKCHLH